MPRLPNELPIRISGVEPCCLSPDQYAEALPVEWSTPAEVRQAIYWYASSALQDVARDGVHFKGRVYFHPAIMACVSTGRRAEKPTFLVRYDAARLASGVLEDIELYVKDLATNAWRHVARCREASLLAIAAEDAPGSTVPILVERNAYEAELAAQRDEAEDRLVELQGGKAAREDVASLRARRKTVGAKAAPSEFDPVPILSDEPARRGGNKTGLAKWAADQPSDVGLPPTVTPGETAPLAAHAQERTADEVTGIVTEGLASPPPDSQDGSWEHRALLDLAADISSP